MGRDEVFRAALAANLRDDGHVVQEFAQPDQVPAGELLGPGGLLIVDCEPTEHDVLARVMQFNAAHPAAPVLILTADPLLRDTRTHEFITVLYKPFGYDEVHRLVHELVLRTAL